MLNVLPKHLPAPPAHKVAPAQAKLLLKVTKPKPTIRLCVPSIQGNEWKYIKECLDTGWVSSAGPYVDAFEQRLANYTGSQYGVACVNGTAALQIALKVVGVEENDEVLVPTLTFIATINAIAYLGGRPVFMDCDEYYNLDVDKTIEFLNRQTTFKRGQTYNRRTGRRVAAIVPVHIYGNAARMQDLVGFCRSRNIKIVEDAAESLGTVFTAGELAGRHTGTVGDVGCLSFNGNKVITTGAGGMVLTNHVGYAERAKYLTTQAKNDDLMWIHDEIGYNYRLANIQAALGVAQFEQLPKYLEIKKHNHERYRKRLRAVSGLSLAEVPGYARNNHWMYPLQIDRRAYGRDRDQTMRHLAAHGIETRPVWFLNHRQKPYRACEHYKIERAQTLWETTVNLPCSVSLRLTEIDRVVEELRHG